MNLPSSPALHTLAKSSPYIEKNESRSQKDSEAHPSPGTFDILCGRGRGYFDHPGNRRMLGIVNEFKGHYKAASKADKSSITGHVLHVIQETEDHPARFLKQVGKGKLWQVLSDKEAHKKVAHTLREHKTIIQTSTEAIKRSRNDIIAEAISGSYKTRGTACKEVFPHAHKTKIESKPLGSSSSVTVSDDESSQSSSYGRSEPIEDGCMCLQDEPLSFQLEPVFTESEINLMLHTMAEDDKQYLLDNTLLDDFDLSLDPIPIVLS